MFARKMPVSQAPDKNEFTIYNPHKTPLEERDWPDTVKVISIDPGIRNFTLRVESRNIRKEGFPIKTVVYDKLKISDKERKLEGNVDHLYLLITNFLDKYLEVFKTCHIMMIERQLPTNYKAVRISQHALSYFLFHLKDIKPNLAMIFEVDPKLKGRQLGASKQYNERGLKQWAVEKAKELLAIRGDTIGLSVLQKNKTKADDHADTLIQIEAVFAFNKWPVTSPVKEVPTLKIKVPSSVPTSTVKLVPKSLPSKEENKENLPNAENKVTLKILRVNN